MVKRLIFFVLLAGCAMGAFAQAQPNLFPVKKKGLWGFIDDRGLMAIQPQYDLVEPFGNNRFAKAKKGGKVVVIDRLGARLDGLEFEDIEILNDSTFAVSVGKKWCIATPAGKLLFEPRLQKIRPTASPDYFGAQLAGRWGMVSREGKELVPAEFDCVVYNGVVFVTRKDFLYGIYSGKGAFIRKPIYRDVKSAGDIVFCQSEDMLWGAMSSSGEPFLNTDWDGYKPMLPYFIELRRDKTTSALYHIPSSSILIDTTFSEYRFLWPYSGVGYINVPLRNGITVFDSTGRRVISPKYDEVIFPGTFLYVRIGSQWGLVDANGDEFVKPQFTTIDAFSDNAALVEKSGSWGVINSRGKLVIPAEYDEINIAALMANCRRGKRISLYALDENGNVLSVEDYTNVRTIKVSQRDERLKTSRKAATPGGTNFDRPSGWFFSRVENKWGLKDSCEKVVIPPKFSNVIHYENLGVTRVEITLPEMASITVGGGYIRFNKLYGLVSDQTYKYVLNIAYIMIDMDELADGKTGFMRLLAGNGKYAVGYTDGTVLPGYTYIGYRSGPYTRFLKDGSLYVKNTGSRSSIMGRDEYMRSVGARFVPANNFIYSRTNTYFICSDAGRWGYLDSTGREVIPASYDFASDFEGDRAITVMSRKWGVINPRNEPVIRHSFSYISYVAGTEKKFFQLVYDSVRSGFVHYQGRQSVQPKYMQLGDFHEGFASIKIGGRYNFTDLSGKTLSKEKYRVVKPFSEGLAAVRVNGGYWRYVNTSGREVIKTKYTRCGDFHQGLAWFYKNGKYGFMDTEGKVAIPARYDKVKDFNPYGLCIVKKNKKFGLINLEGKEAAGIRFSSIGPYSEGLAVARFMGSFQFLDTTGKVVKSVRGYNRMGNFSDGAAWVLRHGDYGFVNREGDLIIKTKNPLCTDFENGVCIIGYKGKQGVMDKNGDLVVSLKMNVIGRFQNGLALVKDSRTESYHYIDRNGMMKYGPYENAFPYQQGVARVQQNGKWGLIDTNGLFIVSPVYDGMNGLSDEYIVTRQNGIYGLADRNGKIMAEPEFSIIRYDQQRKVFQLEMENVMGYLRPDNTWLWPLQE